MLELRRGLRLAAKPLNVGCTRQVSAEEHLDRHGATEAPLDRFVNNPHATAADLLEQMVVAECCGHRGDSRDKPAERLERLRRSLRKRQRGFPAGTLFKDCRLLRHGVGQANRSPQLANVTGQVGMRTLSLLDRIKPRLGIPIAQGFEDFSQPLLLLG